MFKLRPDGLEEPTLPLDWISQATSGRFVDPDARRGGHYSRFISKLEAIQLAADAVARNDDYHDDVAHDFCDQEGLYGEARKEVLVCVFNEFKVLSEFFYAP